MSVPDVAPARGSPTKAAPVRTRALPFIVSIVLLAVAALFTLPLDSLTRDPLVMGLLVVLAVLAGARPVRIPKLRVEVSPLDTFLFTAIAALGGAAVVVVALFGVLAGVLTRRPISRIERIGFNIGSLTVSAAVAWHTYVWFGGTAATTISQTLWPLVAASTVYFILNTGLVTAVIAIDRSEPFFATWARSGLWTAVSNFTGLTLAAMLIVMLDVAGPAWLALGIPPCWLLAKFYTIHKERLEEQQQRIEEVVVHNVALEDKVQERTLELQTALARIEETNRHLRVANERLGEANRAKSAFLANVSHELRTPLNAIIGFSDLIRSEGGERVPPEHLEYVGDIHASGVHLLNLINDILDLSKIETGKLEVRRLPVDPGDALIEATSMVRPQARKKEIAVGVDCGIDGMTADVDPGMFRQMLVNLLSNAVKFTLQGGTIAVRAWADGRDLRVEVRDSGIGIAPEHHEKVFDEFFQVDGSFARRYQGTGLGLALVRRLAVLHGGEVSVESAPGAGSTFRLVFPGCLKPAHSRAPSAGPGQPHGAAVAGTSVLVIEDNPVNLKLVRNVLRMRGFTVLEATDAEEAIRVLRRELPDVVLTDIQLPGMDGLELTRRIKADAELADIPVIVMSAHVVESERERAHAAGCAGYVTKPIQLNMLAFEIGAALEQRERRQPA